MAREALGQHGYRLDLAASHGGHRSLRGGGFLDDIAALPGDEHAARHEQRKGKLDELIEPTNRPNGDRRPPFPVAMVTGELLRPGGHHHDPPGESRGLDRGLQERRLLADRLDEGRPLHRQDCGQRDTRKPAATPEIQERTDARPVDPPGPQDGCRREAVDDMADRDRRRIADRGEVDRGVPGDQQADVVGDDPPGVGDEVNAELLESRIEGLIECCRKRWNVLNARRERFPRTVQAPLLLVVPLGAVQDPLPASSFIAPPVGSRSSVTCPVRGRVSPCPSQVPVPE